MSKTPLEDGYKLVPEWHPQDAIWLTWPQNTDTWKDNELQEARKEYATFMRTLLESQKVNILVNSSKEAENILHHLESISLRDQLTIHTCKTNDAWIRDYGPDFVINSEEKKKSLVNWKFNSWGEKYPPFDADNAVFEYISLATQSSCYHPDVILEGGSFDINGKGSLLTTASCLLNKNRNPALSKNDIEQYLQDYLGATEVIWLTEGIEGDDTDGHVDDISRFVSDSEIVTVIPETEHHSDYATLHHNRQILAASGFDVIELPAPTAVYYQKEILPASYANFLMTNEMILVPQFGVKEDKLALDILKNLSRSRVVIGLPANYLLIGLGSFHCLSKQEPSIL